MKAFTPEISWHNRLPALSLDIIQAPAQNTAKYKLATGGNDCRVYIWQIDITTPTPQVNIVAGLRRHQSSIGAVRFSSEKLLASGDDDGYVYVWRHNPDGVPPSHMDDDGFDESEVWLQERVLRGHVEDICDLSWSKDGKTLLSGSVDNTAILWDALKGTKIWVSDPTKGYVQGVSLDPKAQYMATISSDRILRVYNFNSKKLMHATRGLAVNNEFKAVFCDDTLQTFCRRIEYSPDGQFLLAPAAKLVNRLLVERPKSKKTKLSEEQQAQQPATKPANIFLVIQNPNKLKCYYPTGREIALCVRFSPVLYKLKDSVENLWAIPYRMIFAVATARSVLIYDSQQPSPIGYVSQIHLARLTDVSWSGDGRLLMISSYDGYNTFITFGPTEFGETYTGPVVGEAAPKVVQRQQTLHNLWKKQ